MVRISHSVCTPFSRKIARNVSRGSVEWPIVSINRSQSWQCSNWISVRIWPMSTILEIPIPKLQNTVVFDPPLTDEEFERMSMANELVKLERTKEGKILVNPPAGANSSSGNTELIYQLKAWWKAQNRKGTVYGPDSGFFL